MEGLMNEIEQLGKLEIPTESERCEKVTDLVKEIQFEFDSNQIITKTGKNIGSAVLPLSYEKMYKIVVNLIKNAVSFSPEKGSVSLTLSVMDNLLQIKVKDKGPGIPADVINHISERFYSYRPGNNTKHSGLGLAIVKDILTSCNGNLRIVNKHGQEAEFICLLPVL